MTLLLLVSAGATLLAMLYYVLRQQFCNLSQGIPVADQPPIYKRLLVEPGPEQAETWKLTIPNAGLIEYRGRFNQKRVLLTSPEAVEAVLISEPYALRRPAFVARVLRGILGEGVFVAEGDSHKAQRRLMQQPFKPLRIRKLNPTFKAKATELGDVLDSICSQNAGSGKSTILDIAGYLRRSTLDIIGLAGFGLDFGSLKNPNTELFKQYVHAFEPDESTLRSRILTHIMPVWLVHLFPLKCNKDLAAALAVIKGYIKSAINTRGSKTLLVEKSSDALDKENGNTVDDVIGVLMCDSGVDDMNVLVDQSMNMLGAGHDTVYGAMICAVFELSKRPVMQERLRQEVRSHLERSDKPDTSSTDGINGLPYLTAFCNEVYRFWPPVPNVRRESTVPLNVLGYSIPQSTVFVHSYRLLHRSPDLWNSDPHQFDPERWMKDPVLGGALSKRAFAPFGVGTRACIGENFARAEVKHLIAMLVSRFVLSFEGTGLECREQELRLQYDITTKFIGGLAIRFEQIKA
jgi:cytochrome P450